MAIKIDHNAKEVARDILKWQNKFDKEIRKTFFDTFDVASDRVVAQTVPGGIIKKGRFSIYTTVPGATVPRISKRTGRVGSIPIFHKTKIVERSGDFTRVFRNKTADLIKEVEKKGTTYIGVYGVKGLQGSTALSLELKMAGGRKPRKPVTKALRFAAKRFLTILANNVKSLKL